MKKRLVSILLLVGLMAISVTMFRPTFASGYPSHPTHNNISVDGIIGTDWTDGNYTVRLDPDGTGWGPYWGTLGMYFALNATGIALGLDTVQAGPTGNQFNVFIDTDTGGLGLADYSKAGALGSKKLTFTSGGFVPNFVLYGTGDNNWAQTSAWKLYKFTDTAGSTADLSATPGYVAALLNDSTHVNWDEPEYVEYEAFIPWEALYTGGVVPNNAEIRLFGAMIGGNPGDVIPDQYLDVDPASDQVKFSNYVAIKIADGTGNPKLIPDTVGWPGANADLTYTSAKVNEKNGKVILNLEMQFYYEMWWTGGAHDYINTTAWPTLYYKYYNSTTSTNSTEIGVQMFHQAGYYAGSNEIYNYIIKITGMNGYAVGDKFYWYILAGSLTPATVKHFVAEVGPMPPIDIGFVGNVNPGGGFKNPGAVFDITVHIEQLWNGSSTDPVQLNLGAIVTLNYTKNDTEVWAQKAMTFDGKAGTRNVQYKTQLGPFIEGNVSFQIIVTHNNTKKTAFYTVLILIPPPETEVFYMTDPANDEWGIYPWNTAFGGRTKGLFDILEYNVSANIYGTSFHFRLADSMDPKWGGGNFSHQLFVVMIDTIPDVGSDKGVLRSYVNVQSEYKWDIAFYVDGWIQRYFTPATIDDPQLSGHGITTKYEFVNGQHWYSFNVPKWLISSVAEDSWKYYVMCGSGDFNNFREHAEVTPATSESEWTFGGGADGDVDPNYCDLLVPPGGDSAAVQELISTSYNVGTSTRATILAVGEGLTFVADTTNPLVSISEPLDAATFSWTTGDVYTIKVNWTASDPTAGTLHGLKSVKVYVNSVLVPGTGINSRNVDLEVGENVIRVVATDKSDNSAVDEITVTLTDDRPTPTTSTPKPVIPGYPIGLILIASIAAILYLYKKRV